MTAAIFIAIAAAALGAAVLVASICAADLRQKLPRVAVAPARPLKSRLERQGRAETGRR